MRTPLLQSTIENAMLEALRESAGIYRSRRYVEDKALRRIGPCGGDRLTFALYMLEQRGLIEKKSLGWSGFYYRSGVTTPATASATEKAS